MLNRFYLKELKSGHYHICARTNNLPIYDNSPNGDDAPLVFKDYDFALEYLQKLNNEINKNEN
jgi:hypothetical protein